MNFRERKQARKDHYLRYVHGWKQRPCTACNGSGRYDNDNSPPCAGCDGTGKERYKPTEKKSMHKKTQEP